MGRQFQSTTSSNGLHFDNQSFAYKKDHDAGQGDGSYFDVTSQSVLSYYDSSDTLIWSLTSISILAGTVFLYRGGFHVAGGTIFAVVYSPSTTIQLVSINISTGVATLVGASSVPTYQAESTLWSTLDGTTLTVFGTATASPYYSQVRTFDTVTGNYTENIDIGSNKFFLDKLYDNKFAFNTKEGQATTLCTFAGGTYLLGTSCYVYKLGDFVYLKYISTLPAHIIKIPIEDYIKGIEKYMNDTNKVTPEWEYV